MNKSYSVHAGLETMTVWVKEDIFFDLETNTDNWIKCKLFGLTCLEGRVPTFEILTNDGYVFSDIPPHMIRWCEKEHTQQYLLEDLIYNNCLSEDFVISEFKELLEQLWRQLQVVQAGSVWCVAHGFRFLYEVIENSCHAL